MCTQVMTIDYACLLESNDLDRERCPMLPPLPTAQTTACLLTRLPQCEYKPASYVITLGGWEEGVARRNDVAFTRVTRCAERRCTAIMS